MNIVFVQIVEIRPPSRYFETRWVPHVINREWAVWVREGVDLRHRLGVAFATEWMIRSIQRLPFKTLPGCPRVLILVRWRGRGGEGLIIKRTGLRKVAIPLLVWLVIEHGRIDWWMRMRVLWWAGVPERVRCVELRFRNRTSMKSITTRIFAVLSSMAKSAPASGPSVVT